MRLIENKKKNVCSNMKYVYPSGSTYEGDTVDGNFEGHGEFRFINGDMYVGKFQNDMFNGHGEYRYHSGSVYRGDFENDEFHGIGTLIFSETCIEKGKFQKGKRVGKFYQLDDGEYYLVIYNNDKADRYEKLEKEQVPEEKLPVF